jgi:hypothetical protein
LLSNFAKLVAILLSNFAILIAKSVTSDAKSAVI